ADPHPRCRVCRAGECDFTMAPCEICKTKSLAEWKRIYAAADLRAAQRKRRSSSPSPASSKRGRSSDVLVSPLILSSHSVARSSDAGSSAPAKHGKKRKRIASPVFKGKSGADKRTVVPVLPASVPSAPVLVPASGEVAVGPCLSGQSDSG